VSLPANVQKRGLSKEEAAEYCGVSENTLGRYGPTPTKIGKRTIYDRRMLGLPGHRDRPVGPYPKTRRCGRLPRCSPKPKTFRRPDEDRPEVQRWLREMGVGDDR
jgi:hypothetical protein